MSRKIKLVLHRFCLIGALLFCTVGCDQFSKIVIRDTLPVTGPLSYFGGALRLEYARNPGAFLSWGANWTHGARFWFFNVICGIFLAALMFALIRSRNMRPITLIGLTLVLGGGVGNLIDRLTMGSVTDFLFLHLGPVHTGIFNFADMAIVLGVILVAWFQPKTV